MSGQSIWFFNDPFFFQENEDCETVDPEEPLPNDNSQSSSETSSVETMSNKDSINMEPFQVEQMDPLSFKSPSLRKNSQALKFVQYLKGYDENSKKGQRRLLSKNPSIFPLMYQRWFYYK